MKYRILAIVLVGVLLSGIIISVVIVNMSKSIFVDTFSKSQEKVFLQVERDMDVFHSNLLKLTDSIDASWAFHTYLTNDEVSPVKDFQTIYQMKVQFKRSIPSNMENVNILVVGLNEYKKTFLGADELITSSWDEIMESGITKKALEGKGVLTYGYEKGGFTETTKNQPVLVAAKVLTRSNHENPYAVVYVTMKEKDMEKFYDFFVTETNDVMILDRDGIVVSSNKKELLGSPLDGYDFTDKTSTNVIRKTVKSNGNTITNLSYYLPYFNFNINGMIDNNKALQQLFDIPKFFAICLFITSIIMVFVFSTLQQTLKPLSKLVEKMSRVRDGQFDQYVEIEGANEIKELSITFNSMLDELNKYINQIVKVQEEKRRLEIHALQMQINPHYIFNTLSSIKWLIWQGDPEKSTKVLDAFIMLLRNTISNTDEFITVEEEMRNLENYMLINNTRYGDKVSVEMYVMEDCEEYMVPKLILQPFIENAFFHAFPSNRKGTISIFVRRYEDNIRFEIIDDGIGMNRETLQYINDDKGQKKDYFTGIGINNVDNRIKMIYGMNYGIQITSEPDRGTKIIIYLPINRPKI